MAISSIGVGSGLPLEELLTNLRNSENTVLKTIQTRQIAVQSRLSAYGKIKSSLEALKSATDTLANVDTYGARKSTVSDDSITATASAQAIAGQYSIKIDTLATTQTLATSGMANRASAIGTGGQVSITLNNGTVKVLDLSGKDTSLDGLIAAINADPDLGVGATMVKDGSANPFRLLLTAAQTGVEASVAKIEVTGNATLQTAIGFIQGAPGPNIQEQAATNATLHINGIPITSQTNQVEDAIEGVSISLNKTNTDPTTLSITQDNSVTSKALNGFVAAYNNLQGTIKSLTSYDIDTRSSSALTGDALARRVQNQVRAALNVATSSGVIRSLSQLGIKTQITDGTLTIDSAKIATALDNNMADVQNLFSGDHGVAAQLNIVTESFLRSDGLFSTATEGINRTITDLQSQYDAALERIDAKMETYRQQFTSLDAMVARMNSVSSYLTQQLSMLGNLSERKS